MAARPGFRLGWGRFPDGAEVLYLYDRDDGGVGFAVNLTAPGCSEWGYAPFFGRGRSTQSPRLASRPPFVKPRARPRRPD